MRLSEGHGSETETRTGQAIISRAGVGGGISACHALEPSLSLGHAIDYTTQMPSGGCK